MTITLEIAPEIEAELARQARASGMRVEAYVEGLIVKAADSGSNGCSVANNLVDLFAPLRGLDLTFERDRDTGRDVGL